MSYPQPDIRQILKDSGLSPTAWIVTLVGPDYINLVRRTNKNQKISVRR